MSSTLVARPLWTAILVLSRKAWFVVGSKQHTETKPNESIQHHRIQIILLQDQLCSTSGLLAPAFSTMCRWGNAISISEWTIRFSADEKGWRRVVSQTLLVKRLVSGHLLLYRRW